MGYLEPPVDFNALHLMEGLNRSLLRIAFDGKMSIYAGDRTVDPLFVDEAAVCEKSDNAL
jgi:hypothetical protein